MTILCYWWCSATHIGSARLLVVLVDVCCIVHSILQEPCLANQEVAYSNPFIKRHKSKTWTLSPLYFVWLSLNCIISGYILMYSDSLFLTAMSSTISHHQPPARSNMIQHPPAAQLRPAKDHAHCATPGSCFFGLNKNDGRFTTKASMCSEDFPIAYHLISPSTTPHQICHDVNYTTWHLKIKKQDEAHEPECRHVCWQTETILICHISNKLTCETSWVHTLRWHPCLTLLSNSCLTLLWDTCKTLLTWHSCKTLWLDIFVGRSSLTLLFHTLVRHSYLTLLWDRLTSHSYLTLL